MCICVDPEDHVCVQCGSTSTQHRESRYGEFCCSEECRASRNRWIHEKEVEDWLSAEG